MPEQSPCPSSRKSELPPMAQGRTGAPADLGNEPLGAMSEYDQDLPEPATPPLQTALEAALRRIFDQSVEDAVTDGQARVDELLEQGIIETDPCADSAFLAALEAGNKGQQRAAKDARRWRPVVLAALRKVPIVKFAAEVAAVSVSVIQRHCDADEPFRLAYEDAIAEGKQVAILSAWQAGIEGVVRVKYHMGVAVGYERVHSDKMREMILRGYFPDVFDRPTRSAITMRSAKPEDAAEALTPEQIHDTVRRCSPLFLLTQPKPEDTAK